MAIKKGIKLTTGADSLVGDLDAKNIDDIFIAKVLGNSNTFQSGDEIDGGKGTDQLDIVLGNESGFAISAETTGVEVVSVRSQSTNTDGNSGDNNVSNDATIDHEKVDAESDNVIDAQDMSGVVKFENIDSRADLVIEDIRIGDLKGLKLDEVKTNYKGEVLTESVTISWKNTDPSSKNDKVDYEVYFSPESLRADYSRALELDIYNTGKSGVSYDVNEPLADFYFDTLVLNLSGTTTTVDLSKFSSLTEGKNYDKFEEVLKEALAANDTTKTISIEREKNGYSFIAEDGSPRKADLFTLVSESGQPIIKTGSQFKTSKSGTTDTDTSISTKLAQNVEKLLITSKVVLDNVGRESEAGDLVIGSMSTRSGVEKFTVDVLRTEGKNVDTMGNWVGSMSSTNEKLQEVVITKNDGAYLYVGTGEDPSGNNLTVKRDDPDYVNADGLNDVRVFDASIMKGNVKVGAILDNTDGADGKESAKYNLTKMTNDLTYDRYDSDEDGYVDFNYTTGKGNDTVNLVISDECDLNIVTNSGDDKVRLDVTDINVNGVSTSNVSIGGQVKINLGSGENTLELDNEAEGGWSNDTIVINTAFSKNIITNFNTTHDKIDLAASYSYLTNGTIYQDTNGDGAYTKLDDLLIGTITVNGSDLTGVTIV